MTQTLATIEKPMEKKESQPGSGAVATAFRLIMEPEEGVSASAEHQGYFEIPEGVSHLLEAGDATPRLVAGAPAPDDWAVHLEPVTHQGRLRLLLINPAMLRLRVNDQSAPRLLLLSAGDIIRIDDGVPLEVGLYWRPSIGSAPEDLVGGECVVCRTAFGSSSRCYRCPCGAGLHLEEGDEAKVLKCALTIQQCRCGRPIMLTEGYEPEPQFHHE